MHHSLTDPCPVCAGLQDFRALLQGYVRDRCVRVITPLISEMLFKIQAHVKACVRQCVSSVAALDLYESASALLTEIYSMLNAHRLYLEYAMHPYDVLQSSGVDLKAMRGYMESNGLLPLRQADASDEDFAAALDKYLNLCEREGMYHIVERWVWAMEPELVLEPPF